MRDLISRQAAIDEIKEIYEWHDNVTKERIIEHFKQLPPANNSEIPNSSDTISRAKAIETLTEYGNGRAVFISVGEAVIRMEQLPPAQPEPLQPWEVLAAQAVLSQPERIKGHWIPVGGALYQCDQCGVVSLKRKFCSECGADMREL